MTQHIETNVFIAIEPALTEQSDASLHKIQDTVKQQLFSEWKASFSDNYGTDSIFPCYSYDCEKEKHGVSFNLEFDIPSYYEIMHQNGEKWTEFNVPNKEEWEQILKDAYAKAVCLELQLDSQDVTAYIEDIITDDEAIMEDRLYRETHPEETCCYGEWMQQTLEKYPDANPEVLSFIEMVTTLHLTKDVEYEQTPEYLFTNGLCWYFAKMLQENFGGEVMWHKFYSHIVWQDQDGAAYDAHGVFDDYEEGDLLPVCVLSKVEQKVFRHIGHFSEEEILNAQLETLFNTLAYEKEHGASDVQIWRTQQEIDKMKREYCLDYENPEPER